MGVIMKRRKNSDPIAKAGLDALSTVFLLLILAVLFCIFIGSTLIAMALSGAI